MQILHPCAKLFFTLHSHGFMEARVFLSKIGNCRLDNKLFTNRLFYRSVTITHLWCTCSKFCNIFYEAFLFQCQHTYCCILKWNVASFDSKLCISQLWHTRRLNSFPIIRAAEIYLFQGFKRKDLKCYLQQMYAFIISLDDYSNKEKVKNMYI